MRLLNICSWLGGQTDVSSRYLPTSQEAQSGFAAYVNNQHKAGKRPTVEKVRKGVYSPSSGWTMDFIRQLLRNAGFVIHKNDRVYPAKQAKRVIRLKNVAKPQKLRYHNRMDDGNSLLKADVEHLLKYDTYGIKYIGSKRSLLPNIGSQIQQLNVKTAIDVFTGTTRVAQFLRQMGIKTYTSDLAWASEAYANTFVHNQDNRHLQIHVDAMNSFQGVRGWLTENYTGDVSVETKRGNGRCWQPKNAMKADEARDYIETLKLAQWEKDTLIATIIFALDKVDNTVGVQQAYLKEWCERSKKDIRFELPPVISGPTGEHFVGDALEIEYPRCDLAYLDPPYSAHSYATYYHIWDSIHRWDKPETALTAKRRIDRVARANGGKNVKYDEKTVVSKWNLRDAQKSALQAFEKLIARLPVRYVVISYSDESIIKQQDLREMCERFDKNTQVLEIDYRRNIMSQIGNAVKNVTEVTPESDKPKKNQKNKELLLIIDKGI
jgi:adenine-specific DNA-methyltransferase